MPWHRPAVWESYFGIPLPPSTRWELCEQVADLAQPPWKRLKQEAERARPLFVDDTWFYIQSEMKRVNATGVVALVDDHWVVLYLPGGEAAGGKLEELLLCRRRGCRRFEYPRAAIAGAGRLRAELERFLPSGLPGDAVGTGRPGRRCPCGSPPEPRPAGPAGPGRRPASHTRPRKGERTTV